MDQNIFDQIDQGSLFQKFPIDMKAKLAAMSNSQKFGDGQIVYRVGDLPNALYGVLEGAIKLTSLNEHAKPFWFGIVQPGWWIGDISVLDGEPRRANCVNSRGDNVGAFTPQAAVATSGFASTFVSTFHCHFLPTIAPRRRHVGGGCFFAHAYSFGQTVIAPERNPRRCECKNNAGRIGGKSRRYPTKYPSKFEEMASAGMD